MADNPQTSGDGAPPSKKNARAQSNVIFTDTLPFVAFE
jgi:hypothetical protein